MKGPLSAIDTEITNYLYVTKNAIESIRIRNIVKLDTTY